ncbi:MAG TPA: TonB-dependent receptor [Longimicrobiaceae bacterium]|nr:TonB-dependent receptor [Longimicrobiaceae bacterium]
MNRRSTPRPCWRSPLLLALLLALFPALAFAQSGTVRGTVAAEGGDALPGAQVTVAGSRLSAVTNAQGAFVLAGVPAGPQQLRVSRVGYRPATESVEVRAGEEALVAVSLVQNPVELDAMVVSASRRAERITEAPATITRIGPEALENAVGNSFVGALKQAKGLDFIQVGATAVAINARGFNSSFNNRMLMMEDGRVAVLPENGLPVGQFTATPKVDLAGLEVIVGPGAALYGADASSGVLTLQTKDPRDFPGTTVEVTGGNRSYKDVQVRQAGVFGDWGYKVAGEYQDADDWSNKLKYGTAQLEEEGVGGEVDWTARVARGSGAVVRYFGDAKLEVSGGMSRTDGVGQTNVGRNQLDGWLYNFAQARFQSPRWYATAYRTQSKSGDSYAINRFTENKAVAANAGKSDEELRLMSDWPSDGQLYAAELQNNFQVPALLGTRVVWGVQGRRDVVSSDRQWLADRLSGDDLSIDQWGVYAQTETQLLPRLQLLLAGRYDDHESYEAQFSPKAGLVFTPADGHTLRGTYNRAFKSPTILQTSFYIPDWNAVTAVFGNTQGYSIRDAAGLEVASYTPLTPEENQTWELGYKGLFRGRLFVDVAGYYSTYQDFLSPLAVIANPFAAGAPTFAYDQNGQRIVNAAGIAPLVLTYYNLGEAKLYGTDAGVDYVLNPKVSFTGTFSWLKLGDVEVPQGREEATSLNSPVTKWSLGTRLNDLGGFRGGTWQGGATMRYVNGYYFRSGINMGVIPTFSTLDMNLGYKLPALNTTLQLGVSNLFTCSQDDERPFEYAASDALKQRPTNKSRKCGFGLKHQEMINMPSIGTMLFIGARYHL